MRNPNLFKTSSVSTSGDRAFIVGPVTLMMRKLCLTMPQIEIIHVTLFLTNQSLEETKNNIAQFYVASPLGRWGIELKAYGKFIGTIDLHKIDSSQKAAIGYIINKKVLESRINDRSQPCRD